MNKDFEKWALNELKQIQKILLLEDFFPVTISYRKTDKSVAEASFNYPYKSIDIHYSDTMLDDYKKKNYTYLIQVLTHEICHTITDALYSKAYDRFITKDELENERERLTDHIANIVLKNKLI